MVVASTNPLLTSTEVWRPLKNWLDSQFYDFCQFFREGAVKLTTKYTQIWTMAYDQAVYYPRKRLILRCLTRILFSGRTSPLYTVATPRIFKPLVILKADWRYQQSNLFLMIVVNRALHASSCK